MLRSLLLLLALLVLGASPAVYAQGATPAASPAAETTEDLTGVTPLPLEGERRDDFTAFIADALAKCDSPGASVAVVQNGEVVFLEGFGVREVGRSDPVTPDTLMDIGSVTKSVTATFAATLVDDGLVSWETPVVDLLPNFAVSDPAVTSRLTLADLFSAASGLPRRDLEFIFESDAYSPQGLITAVKKLPLTAPVGKRFQYSNQAFGVGGYAAAAAAGAAPDDLLRGYMLATRHRVLNPIGMDRSTFDLAEVLRGGDYAVPHASGLSGTPMPIPLLVENRFVTSVAPAGALWSSARDMAKYLQTQLGHGVAPDGTTVVSAENLERTWQPGIAVPADPALPEVLTSGMSSYGLGWFIGNYGGLELISHSGGTFGFGTEVAFLPDADLGVAILTNDASCGGLLAFAAQYRLFELVFAQEPAVEQELDAFLDAATAQRDAVVGRLQPIDANVVAPILGRFTNPALGEITFRLEEGELVVDAGEVRSRLRTLPMDPIGPPMYVAIDPPLIGAPAWFTFEPGTDDGVQPVLTMLSEPGEDPLVYPFLPVGAGANGAVATPVT